MADGKAAAGRHETPRLLILGGTAEARALAERLARDGIPAITSLAGRTRSPAEIPAHVRVGGFGGAEGMTRYLREAAIGAVIDATHPFAAKISNHAAKACTALAVPRLVLTRPAWDPRPGDTWIPVDDLDQAAAALARCGSRAFLTVGRQELAPFTACRDLWFLVRMIEPPETPLPLRHHELILARGPFREADEIALLRRHRVDALVSKNSGGSATYAKIAAARACGLPVVMVQRPELPAGERAGTVDAVVAWVHRTLGVNTRRGSA